MISDIAESPLAPVTRSKTLTVTLNAMINPRTAGGVESSILSIINSFAPADSGVRLQILTHQASMTAFEEHLAHLTGSKAHSIQIWPYGEDLPVTAAARGRVAAWRKRLPGGHRTFDRSLKLYRHLRQWQRLPGRARADRFVAGLASDVVHFGGPLHFQTSMPYIIEPHDVQHRHYPEFFGKEELAWRERIWSEGCRNATLVLCGARWTKADMCRQFDLPSAKVAVVPRSSVNARATVPAARQRTLLDELGLSHRGFAFYPAMTFAHKNHIRLFEALSRLRDELGVRIELICTGRPHKPHHQKVLRRLEELGLGEQIRFLGPVSDELLATLFRNARYLLFPSLFEGLSQSLLEALHCSLPIVAADQSSIPETIGDAGVLFDGLDVGSMMRTLRNVEEQPALRNALAASAPDHYARYSWSRAMPMLRACYRHAAGRKLDPADQALLDEALA